MCLLPRLWCSWCVCFLTATEWNGRLTWLWTVWARQWLPCTTTWERSSFPHTDRYAASLLPNASSWKTARDLALTRKVGNSDALYAEARKQATGFESKDSSHILSIIHSRCPTCYAYVFAFVRKQVWPAFARGRGRFIQVQFYVSPIDGVRNMCGCIGLNVDFCSSNNAYN